MLLLNFIYIDISKQYNYTKLLFAVPICLY